MTSFEDCVVFASKSLGLDFSLKDKQLETLRALYDGHDCVSVMPTGYGKSVIFQCLPWLFQCKRGLQYPLITLVVSPLTSLMQDQVMTLCEKGIKACFLNCEGMWYWLTFVQCINIYSAKKHCTAEKSVDLYFLSLQYKVKTSQPTIGFPILISKFCLQIADSDVQGIKFINLSFRYPWKHLQIKRRRRKRFRWWPR